MFFKYFLDLRLMHHLHVAYHVPPLEVQEGSLTASIVKRLERFVIQRLVTAGML
jgi:hypothetical protein